MALRTTQVQPQVQFQPAPIPGLPFPGATTAGTTTNADPFSQQILAALKTGYPGRDQAWYDSQVAYFNQRRAENRAEGNDVRPDDYWVQRATGMGAGGADVATAGPYAGQDALAGGGGSTGGGTLAGLPAGFSTSPSGPNAPFSAPGLLAPYNQTFQPTDINTILNSDAFKAAQANGVDQIQRSAAGRGTLLTGGTLKDLASWTNGLALGTLNDQFNRDATTFGTNRDTFWGNQNNAFGKLRDFSQLGLSGAGQLGGYGTTYGNTSQNNANQQSNLQTGQADANATNDLANANNTNNTIGGLAKSAGAIDWSKLFNRQPGRGGQPI